MNLKTWCKNWDKNILYTYIKTKAIGTWYFILFLISLTSTIQIWNNVFLMKIQFYQDCLKLSVLKKIAYPFWYSFWIWTKVIWYVYFSIWFISKKTINNDGLMFKCVVIGFFNQISWLSIFLHQKSLKSAFELKPVSGTN